MGAEQLLTVIGAAGTGITGLVATLMNSRSRDLANGKFATEQLQALRIPDVYASHLCDSGHLVRGWGMRQTADGRQLMHPGMDVAAPQGTVIRAARSGVVEHSGQINGYGECLLLRHSDGSSTLYAHCNDRLVERGAVVQGGSPVAKMGRTSGKGAKPATGQAGTSLDPRCQHFASMAVHLHMSVHGTDQNRKMPASLRFLMATPLEERYGADPVSWAGAHGIRLSATA